jgi:hypothetical protein
VGRSWAKSASGLRVQKKKKGGLRAGLGCGAGLEVACAGRGWIYSFFFQIPIPFLNKQTNLNSNQDLNPSTQKQCSSMNATVNSYISLIN